LIFCDRGHICKYAHKLLECFGLTLDEGTQNSAVFSTFDQIYDFVNLNRAIANQSKLDIEYFRHEFYAHLEQIRTDMCNVLPGVINALNELDRMDIKLSLCTARSHNPRLYNQLSEKGLSRLLDGVVTRQDHYTSGSIKDQVFRVGSSQLWTEPSMCIVIGDSTDDMESAKRTGIYSIGVLTGLASREELIAAGACAILDSFADLPEFIRAMSG
jgi:phosphoglycolate phosphatase-like HAD superfamily hydrolase